MNREAKEATLQEESEIIKSSSELLAAQMQIGTIYFLLNGIPCQLAFRHHHCLHLTPSQLIRGKCCKMLIWNCIGPEFVQIHKRQKQQQAFVVATERDGEWMVAPIFAPKKW